MKKIIITIAIIILIACLIKNENIIIPKEAIRFRVIANSNSLEDQNIKKQVVSNIKDDLKSINLIPKNIITSRQIIKDNIPTLKKSVEQTLNKLNVESQYSIEYGMHYFPEKEYKGVKYEEGDYESLVIKIGEGQGENFWCVLFPPLCLLDGEETSENEIEYTSFIKELINKYF